MPDVRTSMTLLIEEVRGLIGDYPGGDVASWSDLRIQRELDHYRTYARQETITGLPSVDSTGNVHYLEFTSDYKYWESDLLLQDLAFATVTPQTADPVNAYWTFDAQPDLTLLITGRYYNVYAAAASILEQMIISMKDCGFDFSTGQQSFSRSQKIAQMEAALVRLRKKGTPVFCVPVIRDDLVTQRGTY